MLRIIVARREGTMTRPGNQRGYTLLEVVVVLAVICILVALLLIYRSK